MSQDKTLELAQDAGLKMSPGATLPASLDGTADERIKKIDALLEDVEEFLAAACHAMPKLHSDKTDQETKLAEELPKYPALLTLMRRHVDTTASDVVAVGICLRLWAGLVCSGKSLRKTYRHYDPGSGIVSEKEIGDGVRKMEIETTERMANRPDSLFGVAIAVAPYRMRRRSEQISYSGIPADLQKKHYSEDIRKHPTTPGAVKIS